MWVGAGTKRAGIAVSLGFAVWLGPAAAVATELKTTPGSACMAADGDRQDDLSYSSGRVQNVGASALYVVCPVISDDPQDADGFTDFDVRVTVPVGTTVTCELHSTLNDLSDDPAETDSVGSGEQTLDFPGVTGFTWGAWTLTCYLPVEARVRWYTRDAPARRAE